MKLTNDQELDSGSEELFPPLFNNNNNNKAQQQLDDPWGASSNNNSQNNGLAQLGNPWLTPNDQNIPAANVLQTNADPWAVPTTQQQMPTKADDFDLFTSDRAVNQSPLTNSNQNNTNNSSEFIFNSSTFYTPIIQVLFTLKVFILLSKKVISKSVLIKSKAFENKGRF